MRANVADTMTRKSNLKNTTIRKISKLEKVIKKNNLSNTYIFQKWEKNLLKP